MLVLLWHSNEREANKQIGTILNLFLFFFFPRFGSSQSTTHVLPRDAK